MNNVHFLFYWGTCGFYVEDKVEKISETSKLHEGIICTWLHFFSGHGIRVQENVLKSFWNRTIMV